MPIVHDYAAPADLIAQAALLGGQGSAGEDARRFDDQMAQRDRQFNLDYNARLMLAAQNDALRRQQNAATYDTNQQQIAAGIYGHQLQYDTNQQQLEQKAAGQQLQAQTTMNGQLASQMGQAARAHAKQNMELFMADRKAIMEARLNPAQFQAAKTKLQERYGIEWGMPEELMAQQDGAVVQQKVASIESGFVSRFDGKPLIPQGQVQTWLDMGVEPKEIMSAQMKMHSEDRQKWTAETKAEETKIKNQKHFADMEADNLRLEQELDANHKKFQQQMQNAHDKAASDKILQQMQIQQRALFAYHTAHQKWATANATMDGAGGEEPKLEKFLPTEEPAASDPSSSIPVVSSPAEVQQKLASGEWKRGQQFRTPDGRLKVAQ